MLRVQTILHPTDFSACSNNASNLACALARDYGSRLVVLHVADLPVVAYGQGVVSPELDTSLRESQKQLDQLQLTLVRAERRLELGNPADEIINVCRTVSADLIVMGTHGRSGISRLMLGSVAEQVLRQAGCPVLTLKTPVSAEEPRPIHDTCGVGN